MADAMKHLNSGLLCAVDVETTGTDPDVHEIIQICVLPLDSFLKPNKERKPFYTNIKPENLDNIDYKSLPMTKNKVAQVIAHGLDSGTAADLFYEWYEKQNLALNKRIFPLAQNWPFDRSFLIKWLGQKMFDYIFDPRYRDTMVAGSYSNDRSDFKNEPCPYAQLNLGFLCSTMKVENPTAHDAMSDCLATAEIYRRMVMGIL